MPRTQLLTIALLSVHVLLGLLCLAAARGERDSAGLRSWGWGLVVYAAGLAVTLAGLPTKAGGLFAGNALIASSAILTARGVLHYTNRRLDMTAAFAGLGVTVAVLAFANFAADPPRQGINVAAPTLMATVLFIHAGLALLRAGPADARRPAGVVAVVLLAAVALWWARLSAMPPFAPGPVERDRLDLVVASFAIGQILVGVGAAFGLFWMEVRISQAAMARMAFTDSLTGLANRRAIVNRFEEELARAARAGSGLALAVFDLDRFKEVNDTHGHLAGDALLVHIGRVLAAGKRGGDVLGRVGGEEFVVIMTDPVPGGAAGAAERLRASVEATPLLHEGRALAVTVSGGVAAFPADGRDWDQLFGVADARLYEAKRSGRNRVVGAQAAA